MKLPEFAMTYIVYWPQSQVMKVGRAYRSARLGSFVATGAQLISVVSGTPKVWESAAHVAFRESFPRAFAHADESRRLLSRGRGWTECYRVAPDQIGAAVTVFKKAVAPYAVLARPKVQARSVQPRRAVPVAPTVPALVRDEPADVCGWRRQGGGEFSDAAGAVLRVRPGCGVGRGGCDAARVGGPRLVAAVHLGAADPDAG